MNIVSANYRFVIVFVFFAVVSVFVHGVYAQNNEDGGGQSISAPSSGNTDDFFDSNDLVPQGEMAKRGPNSIDPSVQPASKFIVVTKNHNADSSVARIVSAERALNLGRYDSALHIFDSLYQDNKKDPRVLMGRAVSLQRLGRFEEAMAVYEDLSALKPDDIEVRVNMLGLLSTRYPAVALRQMLDLYQENRSHAGLISQIAIAYAQTGDVNSALQFLGVAASIEPHNANHFFNYAIVADRAGKTKQAIEYYERSLAVDSIHGGGRSIPRDSVYDRLAQIR